MFIIGQNLFKTLEVKNYNNNPDLKITLKPTYKCNQMCSFCCEYDNTFPEWDRSTITRLIDKLKDTPDRFQKIFVYYYGGEPTLFKHLEELTEKLFEVYKDRDLFIQCQTNLSIDKNRLYNFKYNNFEFCSSYHMNKQKVEDFIEKLNILKELNILGYCFMNTYLDQEQQFIKEFNALAQAIPDKLKMRFTVDNTNPGSKHMNYEKLIKTYPFLNNYLETQFTFLIDSKEVIYDKAYNEGLYKQCRFCKCEVGSKSLVINYDELCYHCDDESNKFNNKEIKGLPLKDLDLNNFFVPYKICRVKQCHRGLEFKKWR